MAQAFRIVDRLQDLADVLGQNGYIKVVDGIPSFSASIPDTDLATISTAGKVSNAATTAASANTASAIVARDGSGNFAAGTITAALTGSATQLGGKTWAAPDPIGSGTPAAGTFTDMTAARAIIAAAANTTLLAGSGYSVTGSGTSSLASYTGTLNTSGVVHVNDWSIVNTGSNVASTAFRVRGGTPGTDSIFALRLSDGALAVGSDGSFARPGVNVTNNSFVGSSGGGAIEFRNDNGTRGRIGLLGSTFSHTSGLGSSVYSSDSFTPPSGSGSQAFFHLNPTINGTSSGTAYGILLASKTNTLIGGTIKLASFGTTTTDGFTGYTPRVEIDVTGYISGIEQTAPAAPAANGYRLFAQDNGAGKTQLMVIFGSGAAQQIAIEP